MDTTPTGPLISVSELAEQLSTAEHPSTDEHLSPTLLDVRWSLGTPAEESHRAYLQAHIPGAVFLDLAQVLAGPAREDGGGRHPMPETESFEADMRALGVARHRPVVVYDAGDGLSAARAWWMLGHFGHRDVRVLDGGLTAWQAAGLSTASGEPDTVAPGDFTAAPDQQPLATTRDIIRRVAADPEDSPEGPLLDARAPERFLGRQETVDPIAGHIPGAVNLPALELIAEGGGLLPADQLAEAFAARGAAADHAPTVSCGSGVQACHLALAWEVAHPQAEPAQVYIGSWSDWISEADRPVARG